MKYQVGKPGRIIVARIDHGDDVLEGLRAIAQAEDLRAATFALVGAMSRGRFVVGPEREELPPVPVWRGIEESHEVVGFGTIFWEEGEPKVHFHGAYGKRDSVKMGCLREDSEAFIVVEAILTEIVGVTASRERDPLIGMSLLKV